MSGWSLASPCRFTMTLVTMMWLASTPSLQLTRTPNPDPNPNPNPFNPITVALHYTYEPRSFLSSVVALLVRTSIMSSYRLPYNSYRKRSLATW